MTEHSWTEVYEYACKAFGQAPRTEDEQTVLDAFQRNPLLVIREIDQIANAVNTGKIKWAWSAFAKRVDYQPSSDIIVSETATRDLRIKQAKTWITNAGIYIDRPEEVEEALFETSFGDRGQTLRPWANDEQLRSTMLTLWAEQRPRGEKAETDQIAWLEKCKQDRNRTHELIAQRLAEQEAQASEELRHILNQQPPDQPATTHDDIPF